MTSHYETKTWGDRRNYHLVQGEATPGVGDLVNSLVRVTEKRPDNWRFLLFAAVTATTAAPGWVLDIFFDIAVLGLGRDTIQIPGFEHYKISQVSYQLGTLIWSTTVQGPGRLGPEDPNNLNLCDHLVFENLFMNPRFETEGFPGESWDVLVGAYWAPNVHVPLHQMVPEPVPTRADEMRGLFAGEGQDLDLSHTQPELAAVAEEVDELERGPIKIGPGRHG